MDMINKQMTRRLIILSIAVATACSSPMKPTPGSEQNRGQGSASPVLLSFTATPDTIAAGDEFKLDWTGKNGAVSLALKGAVPFVTGLPSSGSHPLRPGAAGYPQASGETVYLAVIGDMASRLETTVIVRSGPTPTPTPSGSGASPAGPTASPTPTPLPDAPTRTPTPPTCPNAKCDSGEDCQTCPQDCACETMHVCVEGICVSTCEGPRQVCQPEYGENCQTCPKDCQCTASQACINGKCM